MLAAGLPDGKVQFGFEHYADLEELVQAHYSKPLRGTKVTLRTPDYTRRNAPLVVYRV